MSSVLFAVLLSIVFNAMEKGSYERMIDGMVTYGTGYIQIQDVFYEEEPSMDNSMLFDQHIHDILDQMDHRISFYVPRIQNFALVAYGNQTRGSMVMGIDPDKEALMNDLSKNLVKGSFLESGDDGIMLAQGLAEIMGINIGDTLVMLGQGSTAAGQFPVKGIVNLRVPEMNNNTVYMSLETAQWFYMAEDRLTALIVMPVNPRQTRRVANEILEIIDREWYNVLTWDHMMADFLALMKFDTAGTMLFLLILYVVIAFGLFGTVLTMMIERQREYGMLISLGMKRPRLAAMSFIESALISLSGALAGMLAAVPVVAYFQINPITLTGEMANTMIDMGFEPVLPFSVDPNIFITQAVIVLILSILIGLYPVVKVLRLNIMKTKR